MESAVSAIGGAIIGALLAFAGAYYLWFLQRERLELSYNILAASIIIPKLPQNPNIMVSVRESLIKEGGDDAILAPVDEVIGFRVSIKNTGNRVVEDQLVTFSLSDESKVISVEPERLPDLGDARVEGKVENPGSNVCAVVIPFVNPGEEMIFSIQSVGGKTTDCRVSAAAPGLKLSRWKSRTFLYALALVVLGLALTIAMPVVMWVDFRDDSSWDYGYGFAIPAIAITALIVLSGSLFLIRQSEREISAWYHDSR
jgi:hypothetical protein